MSIPHSRASQGSSDPYEVKTVRVIEESGFATTVMVVKFEEHEISPLKDSGFYGSHAVYAIMSPHGIKADYKPRRLVRQHLGEPTPILRKVCVGIHTTDSFWEYIDDGDELGASDIDDLRPKIDNFDIGDL